MAKKYNHAFDIAFEVVSEKEDPLDVTPVELLKGLLKRISNMMDEDIENKNIKPYTSVWLEACSCFDSYEVLEE